MTLRLLPGGTGAKINLSVDNKDSIEGSGTSVAATSLVSRCPANLPVSTHSGISVISGKSYSPIWTKFDIASDYLNAAKTNKNVGKFEFGIDFYDRDRGLRSFDVTCIIMMSEVEPTTACVYPHPGEALVIRHAHGAHWVKSGDHYLHNPQVGLSVTDLFKRLLIDASQIPLLATRQREPLDPKVLAAARKNLSSILNEWEDNLIDADELTAVLEHHFEKFPHVDGVKDFFERSKMNADFTSSFFRAISNVAADRGVFELKDLLLDFTMSSKSSVRYSAIEALSYHIDDQVKHILNVRLKTEKNRTVAALIAASID